MSDVLKIKDPVELSEYSWTLINQALTQGRITLENTKTYEMDVELLIRLVQWTATLKAKRPHDVPKPEDFDLKSTTGGDDEKEN